MLSTRMPISEFQIDHDLISNHYYTIRSLSVMPPRNQTKRGNGVVSVLSFDNMGQSLPWVHVLWHKRFGPEPARGPDTAYPQFRPLKKAIFSTAAAPPFWIAETWFLLRNFGYYSPLKPCSESGQFRKFLIQLFQILEFQKNERC